MNVINKLTQWASLIGVIGAIGGGFYAWGEFNTRLTAIEKKDFIIEEVVDLGPVNERIDNTNQEVNGRIDDTNQEIADFRIDTIDRLNEIEEKLEVSAEDSLEGIIEDIQAIKDSLTKATKDIEIQSKVNEIQDQKIEAVRLKATNPLAN
jgi:chemotaxis regulatin CheY-phosphate phosphatase CheZ